MWSLIRDMFPPLHCKCFKSQHQTPKSSSLCKTNQPCTVLHCKQLLQHLQCPDTLVCIDHSYFNPLLYPWVTGLNLYDLFSSVLLHVILLYTKNVYCPNTQGGEGQMTLFVIMMLVLSICFHLDYLSDNNSGNGL